jgi:multiple antibiotic resistance protein
VRASPEPLPAKPLMAALKLTFPLAVTPYGIAALIAVLASTSDPQRIRAIYLLLVAVMLLNLLSMVFIRQIMRGPVLLALQVLGAVLGVLQVGLAVQIIIIALRDLQVLSPSA